MKYFWIWRAETAAMQLPQRHIDGCHWRLVGECLTLSVRKLIMAPRYSDPGSIQRSRHTRLPRSGVMGRGYHLLCWTLNIWSCDGWDWYIKTLSKPAWTGTGEVLPKKCGELWLDFILVLSNIHKVEDTPILLRYFFYITSVKFCCKLPPQPRKFLI